MKLPTLPVLLSWLPKLNAQIWLLAVGRLLSQFGSGFTLVYAPIYFANAVGLSKTAIGLGLGIGSIAGVIGRFTGGSLADSPRWGRRPTLLLSAAISAIADVALFTAHDFPGFVLGNVLMGLGIGLYWPAAEAAVADLTTLDERNEAFALTRLGDNIGLSLGIVLGGQLIALTGNYHALFVIDGLSFLVFFVLIYLAVPETRPVDLKPQPLRQGWLKALRDRALLIYVVVNCLFTTYLAQVQSTLPLYFNGFVRLTPDGEGFSEAMISLLFTWHIVLTAVIQLPLARVLNRWDRGLALGFSMMTWGIGFVLILITGLAPTGQLFWALAGLAILAIATAAYLPSASAFVVDLAPDSLRGLYLSINSQCWAIGYLVGPPLGGWALDQSRWIVDGFWIGIATSSILGLLTLQVLRQQTPSST